jgi:hypothetical protein
VFGNLNHTALHTILSSGEREKFLRPFKKRLEAEKRFRSAFDFEPSYRALKKIEAAAQKRNEELIANPLPKSCSGCPKSFGW